MKRGGLGIPDLQLLLERAYNTSKAAGAVLIVSLLGGKKTNYVAHKACICRAIAVGKKQREFLEKVSLSWWTELAHGAGLKSLWKARENGACFMVIPHCQNDTELSREEFQDNLLLRYGIVP